jgi:hypothetical protein
MLNLLLVLIGGFYLVASFVAARAHLAGAVMDTMIRAIEARGMKPAERWRFIWLLLGAFWVGLAGLFAVLRLQGVATLFVISFAWQAIYLLFLAPRYFDQVDEPDPSGRAQTQRAFIVYGLVTAVVLWISNQTGGVLESLQEAEPWKKWLAGATTLCGPLLLWFKGSQATRWPGRDASETRSSISDSDGHCLAEEPDEDTALAGIKRDDSIQVTLRPSWNNGGLFNSQTGEPIDHPEHRLDIPESLHDLVSDWLCLWREHADPSDPRRQALLDEASLPLIDKAGQVLAHSLRTSLGSDRVSFSPHAEPCLPRWQVTGLRLMADYQCNALWFDADDEGVGDIPTEQLGLSWLLSRDLDAWALSFDESYDSVDPGGKRLWTREQDEEHERQGKELLARLRRELDATGRATVRLRM